MFKLYRPFGELLQHLIPSKNSILKIRNILMINFKRRISSFGIYHSPSEALGLPQPTILDREERSAKYFPAKTTASRASVHEHITLISILRGFQIRGHLAAAIDPLNIKRKPSFRPEFPSRIILRQHRLPVDREKLYIIPPNTYIGNGYSRMSLGDIIQKLNDTYCDTMGIEYMHDPNVSCRDYLRVQMECADSVHHTSEEKIDILKRLIAVDNFERFLKNVSPRETRLSLAGTEAGIIAVQEIIKRATMHGADTFIIGMRRIGRLSVLASVLKKPLQDIFSLIHPNDRGLAKYTYGAYAKVPSDNTKSGYVRVSLSASSSIPETFFPITFGKVIGIQWHEYDVSGDRIVPIIIHGIREISAQGIVYETLKLSIMEDFKARGAIHVVFGTRADYKHEEQSSAMYCTDVMKVLNAPIIHVNADDIDKVIEAVNIAVNYRYEFQRSAVVHIVGYNRWLNLLEPVSFRQKNLHEATKVAKPVSVQYAKRLIRQQVITGGDYLAMMLSEKEKTEAAWKEVRGKNGMFDESKWCDAIPKPFLKKKYELLKKLPDQTGYNKDKLLDFSERLSREPIGFELHPNDLCSLKQRSNMVYKDSYDWLMCEALAFASLLDEGTAIRICGTNVNRRQHVIQEESDNASPRTINMIESLFRFSRRMYTICSSTNSLYATLALQTGFAAGNLDTFVIWESPIGDKISKIQPLMDSYISMAKDKFSLECSIVIYIPHGFSCISTFNVCNGRPERFLQLCNDDEEQIDEDMPKQLENTNLIIVNPSTGANLFHVLRRHSLLPVKRPLILFTPENITMTPTEFRSSIQEMSDGTKFLPIMGDPTIKDPNKVTKILLCTGLIYVDLLKERDERNLAETISIIRLEQISPFPYASIKQELAIFPTAETIFWVQEEPRNQGCWFYIKPRLKNIVKGIPIDVVSRLPAPDMGTRFAETCLKEKREIMEKAFVVKKDNS